MDPAPTSRQGLSTRMIGRLSPFQTAAMKREGNSMANETILIIDDNADTRLLAPYFLFFG